MRSVVLMTLALACKGPTETATPTAVDADQDGVPATSDCDDTNPLIRPGIVDLWNDDVDADCSGDDHSTLDYLDLPVSMELTDGMEFVVACSSTGEPDDLMVMTISDPDRARFLLFEGPLAPGPLERSNASAQFDLNRTGLVSVECVDTNADGRDDFVALFDSTSDDAQGGLHRWFQPAEGFSDTYTLDQSEFLRMPDRSVNGGAPISSLAVAHLNDDGIEDLVVTRRFGFDNSDKEGWRLISGDNPSGPLASVSRPRQLDFVDELTSYLDLDGDGISEVVACTDLLCLVLDDYPFDGSDNFSSRLGYISAPGGSTGPYASGDFDGDGSTDDLVGLTEAGVTFHTNALTTFEESPSVGPALSIPFPFGTTRTLENVGDVDGDGADDIMVWSWSVEATDRRVLSGRVGSRTLDLDEATVTRIQRNLLQFGDQARGDFDGDGRQDLAVTGFGSPVQKVLGVHLSSQTPEVTPLALPELPSPEAVPETCDLTGVPGEWFRSTPRLGEDDAEFLTIDEGSLTPAAGAIVGQVQTGRLNIQLYCDFVLECVPTNSGLRLFRRFNTVLPNCNEAWLDISVDPTAELLTYDVLHEPGTTPIETFTMEPL